MTNWPEVLVTASREAPVSASVAVTFADSHQRAGWIGNRPDDGAETLRERQPAKAKQDCSDEAIPHLAPLYVSGQMGAYELGTFSHR